jgi:hypothetical protein
MMKRYFLPLILVFIIAFASCYYDNEEALYPSLNSACDTLNVTFTATIFPILDNNCLSCHSNSTAASLGNGIPLQNYSDVKARIVNIIGSINFKGTYVHMPKNGGKIKACSLTQFDIWVRKGMPL